MLTYDLTSTQKAPLYETLYRRIRDDILSGVLSGGEKLPSKRALAEHLNVSKITVENAYGQLVAEGFIHAVPKSGYFVETLEQLPRAKTAAPVKMAEQLPVPQRWLADYTGGSAAPDCFPFSNWARLMRQVILDSSAALLTETPFNGSAALRQAIAAYLYRFRGMQVAPAQIVIGAGTEYLYQLLIQLLGRGKCYAVEEPGYQKVRRIFSANAVHHVGLPLDHAGISMAALRQSGAEVLHLSPTHHFPTGIVTPMRRRQELLQWVNEQPGRYILEDDYDSEFRFEGKPLPTLQSIDPAGRVIYLNTLSKTMAPSLRISYMILPPELMARYEQELSFYSCTVPGFEQITLARFISEGYFEKHLNRAGKYYRELQSRLLTALRQSAAAEKLTISGEGAGLHFLLEVHAASTGEEIVQALAQQGIRINCLTRYYSGVPAPEAERKLVINYSGVGQAAVCALVPALEKVLE